MARLLAELALGDHALKDGRRGKAVAVCGLEGAGDIKPHVQPDDIAEPQRADRVAIGNRRSAIDILGRPDCKVKAQAGGPIRCFNAPNN